MRECPESLGPDHSKELDSTEVAAEVGKDAIEDVTKQMGAETRDDGRPTFVAGHQTLDVSVAAGAM